MAASACGWGGAPDARISLPRRCSWRQARASGVTLRRCAPSASTSVSATPRPFFQAEDGIRDIGVTGVQTCALPIHALRDEADEVVCVEMPDDLWAIGF